MSTLGQLLLPLSLVLLFPAALLAQAQEPKDDGHHGHHGHHHDGMQHDFSDAEHWYRVFEGDDRDTWQRPQEVVELMEVGRGMTVADLGAGTGYFLGPLSQAVGSDGRVLGLEPEKAMVEFMAERAQREGWQNVEPLHIPYDDPGVATGTADRILIVNTWHHIGDRGAYARKLAASLTDDGRVYVVDFTHESPHGPSPKHRLPPERVIEELQAGGLTAEVVPEALPYQYVVVGRRR